MPIYALHYGPLLRKDAEWNCGKEHEDIERKYFMNELVISRRMGYRKFLEFRKRHRTRSSVGPQGFNSYFEV